MPKQSLKEVNPKAMYSARQIFEFETPFSHLVQLNRFLVADICNENLLGTIMHKTTTKTRFFVSGQKLIDVLPTLTKEYIVNTIEQYDDAQA